MSKKKKVPTAPHKAVVVLDKPLHRKSGEELVQVNRQQMDRIKVAPDYAATPSVQTGVVALTTSTVAGQACCFITLKSVKVTNSRNRLRSVLDRVGTTAKPI